jgi:hypothetical protein
MPADSRPGDSVKPSGRRSGETAGPVKKMSPEAPALDPRDPGRALPAGVRAAAARAGRRRRPLDPRVLERVRTALLRLPDTARTRHYYEIPGDTLASPTHSPALPSSPARRSAP